MHRYLLSGCCLLSLLLLCSCTQEREKPVPSEPEAPITNRIPIPPEVVANIGITFEQASRGKLGQWLRVSGRLEVPNDRRWKVRSPAHGRAGLRVRLGQFVDAGAVVAVLESSELLEAQQSILSATSVVRNAAAEAEAASHRLMEAEALLADARRFESDCTARRDRLRQLVDQSAGANAPVSSKELLSADQSCVEAKSQALDAAVRRDDLKTRAHKLELEATRAELQLEQQFVALCVLTGSSEEQLHAMVAGKPRWQGLTSLELRAPSGGLVTSVHIAEGEHVEDGTPLVEISDLSELAFRGFVPESDLHRIAPGATTRIEAAGMEQGGVATQLWNSPPIFDEATRSLLIRAWVPNEQRRLPPGISATAQIQLSESSAEETLLLEECVIFDGLEAVVFRRDPADRNVVIRTPVELGDRAAGYVEVLSGLLSGDQVVHKGAFQLKEVGLGKAPEGGHFHADGTWHKGH